MKGSNVQGSNTGTNQPNQPQQQGAMGAAYASAQQAAPQQNQTAQTLGLNLRGALSSSRAPMSRQPSSEILAQLTKVLREEYANTAALKAFEWDLIPLDYATTSNINASAILFTIMHKDKPSLGVGYHAMVIAADSSLATDRQESFQGQTYDVLKTTGDLVDKVMIQWFADSVGVRYPNTPMWYADAEVVPRDFDVTDKKIVRSLAANAAQAAWTEVEIRSPDFQFVNLQYIKDPTLQVRTSYNQPASLNALGAPVRTDVLIDFRSVPLATTTNTTENVERVEQYSFAGAFVELTYDPVSPQQNTYMQAIQQRRPEDSQLYSARLVLTMLDAAESIDNAMQLLALSTAFPMLDQTQPWMQSFLPSHLVGSAFPQRDRSASFDPRDIGALNYEAQMKDPTTQLVDRIDTSAASFDHQQFYMLMAMLVRPGIALAMDVPECGDSTWYNRIFLASKDKSSKAYIALIGAANALTNGHFSAFFDKTGGNIVLDNDERVHLGYYIDAAGVKQDIRNIDLLYMLNKFGANDPTVGRQWTETFTNLSRPMNVNLAIRRKMIETCVNGVVIEGFARRITFHSDFWLSLDKGISLSGTHVRVVQQGTDSRAFQRASSGIAAGGALNTTFHSGAFDRSYGTTGQYAAYRNPDQPQRW